MEVKCCRNTGEPARLHIASSTDSVFVWRGAPWLEMRLERSVHSLTEGKPRISWCCHRSWLWVLLISTQKECDGVSSFFTTCCHMQIFLRGISFRHIWAVEGACLGMRARKSHTSLTRAMKDVQDTHTLLNQFLLAVGFSPCTLEVVRESRELFCSATKIPGRQSGGCHFHRSKVMDDETVLPGAWWLMMDQTHTGRPCAY